MVTPFDAAEAAGNAAAFAGILSAIVLAVLGQLAVTARRYPVPTGQAVSKHHRFQFSLLLGLPLLVVLLAVTYMFVLLSGGTGGSAGSTDLALTETAASNALYDFVSAARGTAFQFAICGSMLAVAAAGTIVFLHLVLLETGSDESVVSVASRTVVVMGIAVDALFLVYGYGDIHAAFYGTYFSYGLWLSNAAVLLFAPALAIGVSSYRVVHLRRTVHSAWASAHPKRLAASMAAIIIFAVVVPTLAFLIAGKHSFDGHLAYDGGTVMWMPYACGAWSSVLLACLIWVSRSSTD